MPPLLSAADSFNSSSATIRPDHTERRNDSSSSFARASRLAPQDSVGREFETLLSGRVGVLQSDHAVGDEQLLNRYLQDFSRFASAQQTAAEPANPAGSGSGLSRQPSEFNPMAFLDESVVDSSFFGQVPSMDSTFNNTAAGISAALSEGQLPQHISPAAFDFDAARPSSAMSNHSALSLSSTDVDTDSGFYTTDMDTDDNDFAGGGVSSAPSPLVDIGTLNLNAAQATTQWGGFGAAPPTTISPGAEGLGGRSAAGPSRPGRRVRGASVSGDEEQKRLDRLEHRRSINRRSAQKHRLRRKEELETLTQEIAKRDATIARLEKDLAVTRAQLAQLASFVKAGLRLNDSGAKENTA